MLLMCVKNDSTYICCQCTMTCTVQLMTSKWEDNLGSRVPPQISFHLKTYLHIYDHFGTFTRIIFTLGLYRYFGSCQFGSCQTHLFGGTNHHVAALCPVRPHYPMQVGWRLHATKPVNVSFVVEFFVTDFARKLTNARIHVSECKMMWVWHEVLLTIRSFANLLHGAKVVDLSHLFCD